MSATGKDHARINLNIWGDDDFRSLTPLAQHLYFVLWTSPNLTYCGSGDWLPKRLARFAGGWTPDDVERAAVELERDQFLIIDRDTDEFLLRSWVKHDGLWRTPNMAVSVANAHASVASRVLRGVVVHEMRKLQSRHPDSKSWTREAVVSMLDQAAVDPDEIESSNPWAKGCANPWAKGCSETQAHYSPTPTTSPAPTPTPAPSVRQGTFGGGESRAAARVRELNSTARSAEADAVARKFNEYAGRGVPSQTLNEVALEVDRLLGDGIDPHQIAAGIKAWHESDRLYASQIPHFVAKAARPADTTKPTKATLKAVDTMTAAEQIIAELESETA